MKSIIKRLKAETGVRFSWQVYGDEAVGCPGIGVL